MSEKISICLVEDYFLVRMSYKHILSKEKDFIVYDYKDAEECLSDMELRSKENSKEKEKNSNENSKETKPFDIVLMDLGLPGINGIEATRRIKERYKGVKVIILTTHENKEEVLASISHGADGYVLKDIDNNMLSKVIRMVNMGSMWFHPNISYIEKDIMTNCIPKPFSTDLDNLYNNDNVLSISNGEHIKTLLTQREYEALKLLVEGKSNNEIADIMTVSVNTAKAHVGSIFEKLSVSDRVQAAVKAVRAKLF